MKKKLLNLLLSVFLVIPCMFALAACGGGSEKADPTLYHLTFTSNIDLTDEQKAQIKVTYAYGVEGDTVQAGVRDEDEIAELKDAGATDEDIAKAGVRQTDGSYYFFDGDPVYIENPIVDGYRFLGYFVNGSSEFYHLDLLRRPEDGTYYLPRWNMLNKDTVLEARYEPVSYDIWYTGMDGSIANPTNPSHFDASTATAPVVLQDAPEVEGYEFQYWYFNREDIKTERRVQEKITTLPTTIDWFYQSGIKPYTSGWGLELYAVYELKNCEVNISYVDDKGQEQAWVEEYITVRAVDASGTEIPGNVYEYGKAYLDVRANYADIEATGWLYDGIYIGDERIDEFGSISEINVTEDIDIVIKVRKCNIAVSFEDENGDPVDGLDEFFTVTLTNGDSEEVPFTEECDCNLWLTIEVDEVGLATAGYEYEKVEANGNEVDEEIIKLVGYLIDRDINFVVKVITKA